MSEIEKMQRYIERTKMNFSDRYDMDFLEARALKRETDITEQMLFTLPFCMVGQKATGPRRRRGGRRYERKSQDHRPDCRYAV